MERRTAFGVILWFLHILPAVKLSSLQVALPLLVPWKHVQLSSLPSPESGDEALEKRWPRSLAPHPGVVSTLLFQGKGKILEITDSPDSTDKIARDSRRRHSRIGDAMVSGHIRAFDRNNLQHSLAVLAAFSDLGTGALAAES